MVANDSGRDFLTIFANDLQQIGTPPSTTSELLRLPSSGHRVNRFERVNFPQQGDGAILPLERLDMYTTQTWLPETAATDHIMLL